MLKKSEKVTLKEMF